MKAMCRRILSLLMIVAILASFAGSVSAMEVEEFPQQGRSSAYFSLLNWDLAPLGNGKLYVYAKAWATGYMTKLGVSSVVIYEKLPNATSYSPVYTYNSYTCSFLYGTNVTTYTFNPTYTKAVPGAQYYSSTAFYAENSSGHETIYKYAPVITAT
ncbi:MAG: hypothetical protein IJA48_04415 [Oscillospiraceae bacterium]|nr:hypothetical protein [Oscillospiraceae bacterium]